MAYSPRHMKWWGWGDPDVRFHANSHPGFWPFAKTVLGIEGEAPAKPPVPLEAVELPEANVNPRFLDELGSALHAGQVCDNRYERVVHAYGKGFRDLFRMRRGWAEGAPDLVVYPENMKRNLGLSLGMWNSQTVLLALIRKGLTREQAYDLVQRNAMKTWEVKHAGRDDASFLEQLRSDPEVARRFKKGELEKLCSLDFHFKEVRERFRRVGL